MTLHAGYEHEINLEHSSTSLPLLMTKKFVRIVIWSQPVTWNRSWFQYQISCGIPYLTFLSRANIWRILQKHRIFFWIYLWFIHTETSVENCDLLWDIKHAPGKISRRSQNYQYRNIMVLFKIHSNKTTDA